ncbi:MOP flippase family protein [Fibrobacterota bacterium]
MNDHLKSKTISGFKWNGISTGSSTILHFITLAVIARYLSPSEFGIMGMLLVIISFAQIFIDTGMSAAIIHKHEVPKAHLSSLFWINILMGILLFGGILFIRPLAAFHFRQPDLPAYLFYVAFLFLITPTSQIFHTLLRKELDFKLLSIIEIVGTLAYSISAVSLVMANFGVYSLIFGQLIKSICVVSIFIFVFRKTWLPAFHFNFNEIRGYLSFGAFQLGERIINYFYVNIDKIIIGRYLDLEALGFYTLAHQIVIFPLAKILPVITSVAFPAFSKIKDQNSAIRKGYGKIINFISFLMFPMMMGMLAVAPEFIRSIYSEKWGPSIPVLQVFCVIGIFWSLGHPIGTVLLAKGRADIGFFLNLIISLLATGAILLGVNWGITGVAAGILIIQLPLFIAVLPVLKRLIGLRMADYLFAVKTPLIFSLIMAAGILLAKFVLNIHDTVQLCISIILGTAVYFLLYYLFNKKALVEFKSMFQNK